MTTWRAGRGGLAFAVVLAGAMGCSSSKSTPVAPPSLLLNRVSVAIVPGGNELVAIVPVDPGDPHAPYTATSSDPAVATAAVDGANLIVTGVGLGTATVTVTGTGDARRTLPVQVYDHRAFDTGDLVITYADTFTKIVDLPNVVYNDAEALLHDEVIGASVWRTVPPAGYHALGSLAVSPNADPNGKKAVMVVKARPGSDALVLTTTYDPVYTVVWTKCARGARFWRPSCPAGYQAMGMVATYGVTPDWPYPTPCIRQDLTTGAAAGGTAIHTTSGQEVLSWWKVDLADVGPHSGLYLAPGSFVLAQGTAAPAFDPAIHVLNVKLPMLGEAPAQDFVPRLTSVMEPDAETPPRFAKAMLVPCSMVNDVLHADVPWRVANSPFYRLERHVYYKRLFHDYNQTSLVQPHQVTVTSGITTAQTNTVRESSNVSITAEAGITLKEILSFKVAATVSKEFGYETQTSVSELVQKEVTTPIHTAPGKAAALWQQYNRYVLLRHEGTALSAVTAWEFGIDSYVTDEYPH